MTPVLDAVRREELRKLVEVKPLEWQHFPSSNVRAEEWVASGACDYHAIVVADSTFRLLSPASASNRFAKLEEAKAAAQADYESRILAALLPKASVREERGMSAPRYDKFNDVYVYAFGDGRFVDISGREVRDRGWAEVTRMLGLKYEPSTERLPVEQYGRVVGTLPADFDLMLVRSKSFLYAPRPGDFKREGDIWIAADSLGSGDFECIPEFRRALSERSSK